MNALPFVSVIIVNYNGKVYLQPCLNALATQTYPKDRFEVILSDNDSSDDSLVLLREFYSSVKIVENKQNLGFASGNNVAIEHALGEYIILLNNDTAPDPEWMENMVAAAINHPDAGIITGHLLLFYDQLKLRICSDVFSVSNDPRELGIQVYKIDSGAPKGVYQYIDGAYGWETDLTGRQFRWIKGDAHIGVPIPSNKGELIVTLMLAANRPDQHKVESLVYVGDKLIGSYQLDQAIQEIEVVIPAELRATATPLEQNTGTVMYRNGYCRDRGTYAKDSEVFFEEAHQRYLESEEVFAGCGASMLIKRQMLEETGGFDDDFFMYYEDVDLSWRSRLLGWKILYAADAIVRHIHCGTTVEWSPNFIYLTERNRLAMVFKNGSPSHVAYVWGGFLYRMLRSGMNVAKSVVLSKHGWRQSAGQFKANLRVFKSLVVSQAKLWSKRTQVQKRRKMPYQDIEAWLSE